MPHYNRISDSASSNVRFPALWFAPSRRPPAFRDDFDLLLLSLAIVALAGADGFCYASNAYFGAMFEVSPRTITRWIAKLEALEYIRCALVTTSTGGKPHTERRIYLKSREWLADTHLLKPPADKTADDEFLPEMIGGMY